MICKDCYWFRPDYYYDKNKRKIVSSACYFLGIWINADDSCSDGQTEAEYKMRRALK